MTDMHFRLPADLETAFGTLREEWRAGGKIERLWLRDASLWTGSDEDQWLGWLDAPTPAASDLSSWMEFGRETRDKRDADLVLLGMGGSSLCPDVLARTFGPQAGFPRLRVLDSTVPAQIRSLEEQIDPQHTLVIVASKSGSTLEPKALMQYFWERFEQVLGARAGSSFVAITDPGSELEQTAQQRAFRRVFLGTPSIGGRFSALSPFGMVPGSAAGIDIAKLLARARAMAELCRIDSAGALNPGVDLGLLLGAAAAEGRDKLTLCVSSGLSSLGSWLEQLVAESTGKQGRAIIPIDREPTAPVSTYGSDRLFVSIRLEGDSDGLDSELEELLVAAGHPIVEFVLSDPYDLGAEFFRWEIATAVAGAVLGLNPFDQPDVEASKVATREMTEAYETTGSLPLTEPVAVEGSLELFGQADYVDRLGGGELGVAALVRSHLDQAHEGDYFALLAFIEMNQAHEELLQAVRERVLNRRRVATTLGFGPRFLHSTGQAHKGGPNTGVFLQLTATDTTDLEVPGSGYSFGTIKAAQAGGDLAVLEGRGRRALRLHLGDDPEIGLQQLIQLLN